MTFEEFFFVLNVIVNKISNDFWNIYKKKNNSYGCE